jgi:uncharacterized membrane protein
MRWLVQRRMAAFVRSSLWLLPVFSTVLGLLAARAGWWVDERTRWTLLGFGAEGARALLASLSAALLTFIVFAFSILLLAVQQSGSQHSPRIISRIFESRLAKTVLTTFVFSFVYSLAALARLEERTNQLSLALALLWSVISIILFVVLIQSAGQGFRPVSILIRIGADTRQAIEDLHPHPFAAAPEAAEGQAEDLGPAFASSARTIPHRGRGGTIQAIDRAALVEIATRAACVVELVPAVGDFVAPGDELFRLHGAGRAEDRELRRCLELGKERTLDQDPAFGIRMIVDIASKALSAAINDPTTAVLALDQLHHLLHLLGRRRLARCPVRDASGEVRLIYPSPRWEDYVELAATEIRLYGATNPQVCRRMTAMLGHLAAVLPEERAAALRRELEKLERSIAAGYVDPADRALARVADRQGLGSRPRA